MWISAIKYNPANDCPSFGQDSDMEKEISKICYLIALPTAKVPSCLFCTACPSGYGAKKKKDAMHVSAAIGPIRRTPYSQDRRSARMDPARLPTNWLINPWTA